jgi:two-component system NtrC family response regulator
VEELKNILVVDNHQNILELLSNLLQMYRYQTFCALDTQSALKLLDEEKVDCVVTDVEMPKPNGFDLLDEIKNRYPQLPVIMISSYANAKMEKQAHENGASGFTAKPFSIEKLQQMIEQALDKTEKAEKVQTC